MCCTVHVNSINRIFYNVNMNTTKAPVFVGDVLIEYFVM